MQKIKAAIVKFFGTNCENETKEALEAVGFDCCIINSNDKNLDNYDLIVLPGGFSYGDYISCGRIAKFTPVIKSIIENLKKRKLFILGICNGFQILSEAGLIKGALLENIGGRFICDDVELEFMGKKFKLPIANHQGRYYIDDFEKLKDYELIKYAVNPNASSYDIAGLYDKNKHILALMPHPERNMITPFKPQNGRIIFEFIKDTIEKEFYGII